MFAYVPFIVILFYSFYQIEFAVSDDWPYIYQDKLNVLSIRSS